MANPTPEEIKKYWDRKAMQLWTDPSATMKDMNLRTMEIEAICTRLRYYDELLDIGCGNAFGTIEFAKFCRRAVAMDYSDKMVEAARETVSKSGVNNVEVQQGSALDLGDRYPERYSCISSVRCLINQPSMEEQYRALDQFAKALQPSGRLFLLEGIAESFKALNDARERTGLPAMKLDWHNRLFVRGDLEKHLSKDFVVSERVDFGEYYFLSRIVHPLLVASEEPKFDGRINEIGRKIWRTGIARGVFSEMSTLSLYICERKRYPM